MSEKLNRREALGSVALGMGASLLALNTNAQTKAKPKNQFKLCLNTSTIMRQNLGLMKEIDLAAKVGFKGIEVWLRTIDAYVKEGGKLADVKKKAADLGIDIVDAIGFSNWMSDDPNLRAMAMEQTKREMDMLQQIGCKRIAAPPFGSTNQTVALEASAARYSELMKVGKSMGVKPQLEIWGFSQNIHLVGQSLFIAAEAGEKDPAILADVYHLYKGGSAEHALEMIPENGIEIFHMNDYPAEPGREKINDSFRVMPGDGVAPMSSILKSLHKKNRPINLSLELFSEKYWAMPAQEVLVEGLDKMKKVVAAAMEA
jgi:2-keto-myo-inositol isomerase